MTMAPSRISAWLRAHFPTREALEHNRWLRPFAHLVLRPELWRFNRRSVPRAIGIGLFVGVTIPFAHTFIAPLVAVFARANVPVAMAVTWTSNPFTWVVMFPVAYRIGGMLMRVDAATGLGAMDGVMTDAARAARAAQTQHHLSMHNLAHGGLQVVTGLAVEGVVLGLLGYLLSGWGWRWWIGRKRRRDLARAAKRRMGAG